MHDRPCFVALLKAKPADAFILLNRQAPENQPLTDEEKCRRFARFSTTGRRAVAAGFSQKEVGKGGGSWQ